MTANDNDPPWRRAEGPGSRGNVAALLAVVAIGLVLFWAVSAIRTHDAVQNCIDSGRRGCVDAGDR